MATGGLERPPAPLGLAERLDAPEWLADLPDRNELGESSRELAPPKMRSRARSYAASRTSSFLSRLALSLASLSPPRRRPPRSARGGRDPLAPASTPRGSPPAGSSLRKTTTRGAGPSPAIARQSLSRTSQLLVSRASLERTVVPVGRAAHSKNEEKRTAQPRKARVGHPPPELSSNMI
jgi:hypothetical protein